MERHPQTIEFRINPENFHPCTLVLIAAQARVKKACKHMYGR